ncbi:MAG: xanthine dehydrogenase family protein molybdopterin-binding subunit [Komarekiella atlantica HA4396-MV6]|jgi:xanthine dehydrogenase YagR molybdenum-binding subunit|nr:xanthine dehydrogenase family protein molybdopterin-binding subunit [Komarekiella atlantica HA4396-MV6]
MAEIGKPINRIDGRLKVTGAAKYAAEFNQTNMAYAFPVRSTIANGTITSIDRSAALKSPGVVAVLTHENAPRLKAFNQQEFSRARGRLGENLVPLQDNKVHYFWQFIGVVVAETYEQARHAAGLVRVTYAEEKPAIDFESELPKGFRPETAQGQPAQLNTGQAASPLAAAPVKIERTYTTPTENHHPMEPHATVVTWEGTDKLTIHESTQDVLTVRAVAAYFFSLKPENIRVLAPFIGGAFGSKSNPWTNIVLAVMAGQAVKRPVKLVITRQMMQTNVGRRSETKQQVALGASRDGKLQVIRHHNNSYSNNLTQYFERSGSPTGVLYSAPLREITYQVARLNIGAPTFVRGPGDAPGSFALESAMDEMAHELKIDPIEFRIINHSTANPVNKLPYSSEHLIECYRTGAEKFGWARRKQQPRQTRDGRYLVGYGTAVATYPASRASASARVRLAADGRVVVQSATLDLGTGTYTIMAQAAADALGVPLEKIRVEIGDSDLPPAPVAARSVTTASVLPAVLAACEMLRKDLMGLATADAKSKLNGVNPAEIIFSEAKFFVRSDRSKSDSYSDILRRNNKTALEACTTAIPASGSGLGAPGASCILAPTDSEENSDAQKYSFQSFGAQFVEVWVDEDLGTIRVRRVTTVHDVGRIMNEKTARSQIIGSVIYALGETLMEETHFDKRFGNPVTRTLADYHVPANLDVPPIDVHFIGKPDPHISPIGARGLGEIACVGIAAAVANAVFNATGKRIRSLPITPDKLL